MALNDKQLLFCEEYLADLNGTQAAIRAGYAENSAGQQAYDLLRNPQIAVRIAELRDQRSARTLITADWLLKRLADESQADVNDLYDENGQLKPVWQWPKIWRTGLITSMEMTPGGRASKLKIANRHKLFDLIGKHINVQAFRESHELVGKGGGPVKTENQFVFVPVGPDSKVE